MKKVKVTSKNSVKDINDIFNWKVPVICLISKAVIIETNIIMGLQSISQILEQQMRSNLISRLTQSFPPF